MDETQEAITILEEAGYARIGSGWCRGKARVMLAPGNHALTVTIFANITVKAVLHFSNKNNGYRPVANLKNHI